jgi:hypothetical protein
MRGMSIGMQLRAMPESGIQEDYSWLEELMGTPADPGPPRAVVGVVGPVPSDRIGAC